MLTLYLAYLDNERDKELFADIYYSYRKQMVTMAMQVVKDPEEAEDIVEDVFLRIAQKYFDIVRNIDNQTDLRNYLLKATQNTAINKFHSKKKENTSLDTILEYNMNDIEELSDDTFIESLCNRLDYDQIVEVIASLSEKYRDVLYYHFVMELTVPETAKLLNQSVCTTKKQLVRGKKMLLSLLEAKGVEDNAHK